MIKCEIEEDVLIPIEIISFIWDNRSLLLSCANPIIVTPCVTVLAMVACVPPFCSGLHPRHLVERKDGGHVRYVRDRVLLSRPWTSAGSAFNIEYKCLSVNGLLNRIKSFKKK